MSAKSGVVSLQLFVTASPKCIEILRYLVDIAEDFKVMQIKVTVVKVPKDTAKLQQLSARGITNTPTMLAPGDKKFIGVAAIKKLFETNMKKIMRHDAPDMDSQDPMMRYAKSGDVDGYMTSLIFQGVPRGRNNWYKDDRNEGDEDESISPSANLNARMKDFESRRMIRTSPEEHERDDRAPRGRRRSRPGLERATPTDEFEDEDRNVGEADDDAPQMARRGNSRQPPPRQKNRYAGKSPAQIDDMMVEALMENTMRNEQ